MNPISCRTSDLTALDGVLAGKLLFGDGQARGLAARLAFHFLLNTVRTSQDSLMGDPEIMRIMQGLIQIPTVISTGGSTGEDLIVAQAVRQNVKASMQLPMNAMEWAGMVLRSCGLNVGKISRADSADPAVPRTLHGQVRCLIGGQCLRRPACGEARPEGPSQERRCDRARPGLSRQQQPFKNRSDLTPSLRSHAVNF